LTPTSSDFASLLKDALTTFRPKFVEGISEFELINSLKHPPYSLFNENALSDSLMLFQTHFVLFHCLYQLRNEWREQGLGELDVGPTQIILDSSVTKTTKLAKEQLATPDPLADYYLNWENLAKTEERDVESMLDSFWQKMAGADATVSFSEHELEEARNVLEINSTEELSLTLLKQQYRKLQHRYHPDKGGNIEQAQAVLHAYTRLRKSLIPEQ
jgi:hypothetical protein